MPVRALSPELRAHTEQIVTSIFNMAELHFGGPPSEPGGQPTDIEPLRVHNDIGTITWDGHDWLGVGDLGTVSLLTEDDELRPGRAEVLLNGLKPEHIAIARDELHITRPAIIYTAARNIVTGTLDGDPVATIIGNMDVMSATLGPRDGSIQLAIDDERSTFIRTAGQLFSNAQQQLRRRGDLFWRFSNRQITYDVRWGPQGQRSSGSNTFRQPPATRSGARYR